MDEIKGIVCPYCKHEHENWHEFLDFEEMLQEFNLDVTNVDYTSM